ncbi:MAG: D-alanine--D-alanine ligase [Chitinispirillaceae bacterium]|nr:D-alanine--D-alanine ligase [Chitinispirillaceae bacterium]
MTIRIAVVMGGTSVEHEISLRSGLEVLANLDQSTYRARAVVISRNREFFYCDPCKKPLTLKEIGNPALSGRFKGPFSPASAAALWEECGAAFLALHGSFGEDGVIQGYLDTIGIPYTGSGVCASAVAMDKIASKFMYINSGLAVPPWSVYGKAYPETTPGSIAAKHGFPCFVKCPQSGSSRLMDRAADQSSLKKIIAELSPHADRLLIETAIAGAEFSCGILEKENGDLIALPPIEIRPKPSGQGGFFDYTAKYTAGGSEEIVPAPQPAPLLERIKDASLAAHRAIGCSGVSRTDLMYADDTLYVLETNTLPGLTPNSLLPKAFRAAGGTYAGLLDTMIRTALAKKAGCAE